MRRWLWSDRKITNRSREAAESHQQHQHHKKAASALHEMGETPIDPDPSPKTRLYMMSASSAASGSGQQHVQRSSTEVDAEAQTEVPMEIGADKKRRLAQRDGNKHRTQTCREHFSGGNSTKQFCIGIDRVS